MHFVFALAQKQGQKHETYVVIGPKGPHMNATGRITVFWNKVNADKRAKKLTTAVRKAK